MVGAISTFLNSKIGKNYKLIRKIYLIMTEFQCFDLLVWFMAYHLIFSSSFHILHNVSTTESRVPIIN